jgi:hypothetical protein
LSSTLRSTAFVLAGLIAGEGCFTIGSLPPRVDGSPRRRFRFLLTMADRDLPALVALQGLLDAGGIHHTPPKRPGWLPTATFSMSGRWSIRSSLIPFCDEYLITSHKHAQYERWREAFVAYEQRFPSNWRAGPSTCAVAGCSKPVRGQGLCRGHYYRKTGY